LRLMRGGSAAKRSPGSEPLRHVACVIVEGSGLQCPGLFRGHPPFTAVLRRLDSFFTTLRHSGDWWTEPYPESLLETEPRAAAATPGRPGWRRAPGAVGCGRARAASPAGWRGGTHRLGRPAARRRPSQTARPRSSPESSEVLCVQALLSQAVSLAQAAGQGMHNTWPVRIRLAFGTPLARVMAPTVEP
jgi:hypothetical protein